MNHSEAKESQAVERYTLDEMWQEERDAFEEHYFDCRVCSEGVRDSARMMAAGRRVARETVTTTNVVRMPLRWKAWIPAAAAAVLLMVNGILMMMRPVAPVVVSNPAPVMQLAEFSDAIPTGASRGGTPITLPAGKPLALPVDLAPEFSSYEILLRNSAGRAIESLTVSAEQAKNQRDQITLLPGSLPAGSYVLVIEGVKDGNRTKITTQPLTVR
ncbi:MAG: hypothetical protein DMF56_08460 [Acidobacteria bacterium]|nr:MAG: hypothetical protein DMF56_08460 [Acidobacteriota bacterium]